MTRVALTLVAALSCSAAVDGATHYDPHLAFHRIRTTHFDIYAHQGEDAAAAELAGIVERVRERMAPELGTPRGRVHVVLVDQDDLANGWATPAPYNTIQITATPPAPDAFIGNATDWLALVFTHEYTHILHLDRSRGVMNGVRHVLGRNPAAFPNMFLPEWQIEGLATYEESRVTNAGRLAAGDFRAIVDVAASRGRFLPMDRAGGGLVDWPAGNAAYAYGAMFDEYLVAAYGPARLAALNDATAGRLPYLGAGAFRRVYGKPVETLWREFERARDASASASVAAAGARRVTMTGFEVSGLAPGPDGSLYYALSDARRFPRLLRVDANGRARQVATRYLGNRTSIRAGWIVYDQLELARSTALQSDLYAVRTDGGRISRLTRGERAGDPDLSPDATTIACAVERGGHHALAIVPFEPGRAPVHARVLSDDGDYSAPRWSADGGRIASARRHAGAFEIVVMDVHTGAVRIVLRNETVRLATPTWAGTGTLLFAAASRREVFNVFALDVASGDVWRVTDSASGARAPEVSADGRTIYYIGYSPDGFDVFSVPLDRAAWRHAELASVDAIRTDPRAVDAPQLPTAPYRPWPTLAPTYWTPVIATYGSELVAGAGTAMTDVLGRHAFAVDAEWGAARARPDVHAAYGYDRWRPALFVSYADETAPVAGGATRSRELQAGLLLPFAHVRAATTLLAAFDVDRETLECPARCAARVTQADRRAARAGWLYSSAHAFGYSISPEEGGRVELAFEEGRATLGGRAATGAAIVDARHYQRLGRGHVVFAARAAAAGSWGALPLRRVFSASGALPGAAFDFGRDAIGLLRGVEAGTLAASRAAVVSADVRLPLARPQRGIATWPVLLKAVHGAVFMDAGAAWDRSLRRGAIATSTGAELAADTVLGHDFPLTFAAGAAWIRGGGLVQGAALFARVGRAF